MSNEHSQLRTSLLSVILTSLLANTESYVPKVKSIHGCSVSKSNGVLAFSIRGLLCKPDKVSQCSGNYTPLRQQLFS